MELNCGTAGFARLDITPPLGVRIGGYYNARVTKGVLDPLYVRAIAFGEGEQSAVLLVCDLLGMYGPAAYEWPVKIAEALGLPRSAVFVCHTHTHTGPVVNSYREPYDEQYDAWLFRRLCDAAQMALDDRKPVLDVRADQTETEGLAFVRRYRMSDGTLRNNPPADRMQDIVAPACEADRTMRLVRILRKDAPELVLINFQVHPDCIGGERISADYPAAVCRYVEETLGNAYCVFTNGGEGQQVRTDRMKPLPKTPDRYRSCMEYGVTVAKTALQMYETAPSTNMTGLLFGQTLVHAKTKLDRSRLDEVERVIEVFETGYTPAQLTDFSNYTGPEAYSIRDMAKHGFDYYDLPVTVFVFCGVALVGLPGEPFNELGKHIRSNSKFPSTSICCQANGNFGYLPVASAYDEGGYEPHNTRLPAGTAELLMDAADKLLQSL